MAVRLRSRPVVTVSSKAPAMPFRPRWPRASIISCRCTGTSQQVVSGAVGDRWVAQGQGLGLGLGGGDRLGPGRLAPSGQDVEDHLVAGDAGVESLADRVVHGVQTVIEDAGQHPNKAPIGLVARAQSLAQPGLVREVRAAFSPVSETDPTSAEIPAQQGASALDAGSETPVLLVPAVPIEASIFPDYIISLEDGQKFRSLRRHLMAKYGMTPEDYRRKWRLPADYPMVAPAMPSRDLSSPSGAG